ncbi:MAG: hypothetical protein J7J43_06560 [Thermosipho sp. (in: Bacteria)]|nr:hypothetical protein [Thermosipho sp. (in: thermotogales)]MCD6105416.1 hypothetical protein [Thermosipho sp. (in: thermotogales)]
MINIFGRRIISFDIRNKNVFYGIGNYMFNKVKIKEMNEFNSNLKFQSDDLIVVNLPWDLLLHLSIDVPGITKEKELKEYLQIEVSQNLGMEPEELYFDYVKPFVDKINVFVVKKYELNQYLDNITSFGIPEPDILYPDILKEMLMLKRFVGLNLYFVISNDYSGTMILMDNNLKFMRFSYLNLEYLNRIIHDEFGESIYDIENSNDPELIDRTKQFLKSLIVDFISEIEREILISINSTNGEVSSDILNGITIITDSKLVNDSIEENYTLGEILSKKFVGPQLNFSIENYSYLGCMGLLVRGGNEIGKVKFIH